VEAQRQAEDEWECRARFEAQAAALAGNEEFWAAVRADQQGADQREAR
jgi:hypothetical protein